MIRLIFIIILIFYIKDINSQEKIKMETHEIPEFIDSIQIKNNKIRAIEGYTHLVINEEIADDCYKSISRQFSRDGLETSCAFYNKEGVMIQKRVYDNKGQIIQEDHLQYNGSFEFKYLFSYHNNDSIVKSMYSINDELLGRIVIEKNTKNKIVKEVFYNKNNVLNKQYKYLYNDFDNLVRIDMGNLGDWQFFYNGEKVTKLICNTTSGIKGGDVYEYFYDERGLLVKKVALHKYLIKYIYEYW